MYLKLALCVLLTYIQSAYNDFVVGMFQSQDYLVAQDMYYRERIPFQSVTGQYGRRFRCPITYFRVMDRLGVGRGPGVKIVRGGLRKPYIVVRFISSYDMPLSLNIYAGCQNKRERPTIAPHTNGTSAHSDAHNSTVSDGHGGGNGTEHAGSHNSTTSPTAHDSNSTSHANANANATTHAAAP